jgi:hypothetical protein
MRRLKNEDLSAEADTWEHGNVGNIRIIGTNLTVQASVFRPELSSRDKRPGLAI